MAEFADALNDCQLLDLGADGAIFSWARGEIFERLDRALIGEGWPDLLSTSRVTNLPRILSDHISLLIQCQIPGPPIRPPFRFQSMWVRHHSFLKEVEECWKEDTGEKGMVNLQLKLGRLKRSLKSWNKNIFGNIFEKVKQAEEEAQEALKRFELLRTPACRVEMNRTATELTLKL
ncbi:uncharacterized protein LOC125194655 [Salvia hispanica]|uniref:uncharacterized protein LOC125194655 n=1 Tax=Salvia hispanica TaxID=49212 RepID=UPI002009224A|nr:uncharacterized protein LOC125194655 [Salvia hispanica]